MSTTLRCIVERAVEEYNKYRAPEAQAKLASIDGEEVVVVFEGSFCYTCGFYDYIDDFKIVLEDLGMKVELVRIEELDEGAIAVFTVKRPDQRGRRDL